jgi:F-box and leucine-rich repeat protein GRR1
MARSRPTTRIASEAPSESSSSSSPERAPDDDTEDFFMAQANDSQSSININTFREMSVSQDLEREHRESPISRLPPELLIAIFAKLSSTSDLLNCMLVSHTWAANSVAILWHRPLCNNWKNLHNVVASVRKPTGFFPYHDLVKRLNLSGLAEKISDGTVQPFVQCKRVERLTLTNCSKLTDMGVSALLEGNKHLQALDVSELDSLTDHTLFTVANNCPRLQGLNITGCVKVTDESLVQISQRCRQIKRV